MSTALSMRQRARQANRRGYTIVEVLSAMTLFAIGAAGVISMQKVTIQGGQDARRLDQATAIAHEWTARLQRDGTFWTRPSPSFPDAENVTTQTTWLKDVTNGACSGNNWCTAPARGAGTEGGMSGAFDFFGRDRPASSTDPVANQPDHVFCVQYRLNWIFPIGSPPQFNQNAVIRAEVRVFYSRLELAPVGDCSTPATGVSPSAANANLTYHFVYAATAVREVQGL